MDLDDFLNEHDAAKRPPTVAVNGKVVGTVASVDLARSHDYTAKVETTHLEVISELYETNKDFITKHLVEKAGVPASAVTAAFNPVKRTYLLETRRVVAYPPHGIDGIGADFVAFDEAALDEFLTHPGNLPNGRSYPRHLFERAVAGSYPPADDVIDAVRYVVQRQAFFDEQARIKSILENPIDWPIREKK